MTTQPSDVLLAGWIAAVSARLDAGETVEFAPRGLSMWPTLRPATDRVHVRRCAAYSPGDIVLAVARRPAGVVLHRIVGMEGGRYILMGDANLYMTESCAATDVQGRVVGILRGGNDVSRSFSTRLLRAVCLAPAWLRRPAVRFMNLMKR